MNSIKQFGFFEHRAVAIDKDDYVVEGQERTESTLTTIRLSRYPLRESKRKGQNISVLFILFEKV